MSNSTKAKQVLLKRNVSVSTRSDEKFNFSLPHPLQRITLHDARSVARLDSKLETSSADSAREYENRNAFSYYMLINTWLAQINERSPRGSIDLLTHIQYTGLIPVIRLCASVGDSIGSGNPTFPREVLQICLDWESDLSGLMQILRYPKRFSPVSADKVASESLASLVSLENHSKLRQRRPYSWMITSRCRAIIADILDGYDTRADEYSFSNGVANDSSEPLLHKLKACSYSNPAILGYEYLLALGDPVPDVLYGKSAQRYYCNVAAAVPKSYKSVRIIAAERADYQFLANAVLIEMERCIRENGYEPYLSLHDQSHNQELARVGSITGYYSTIDLSHASDSVSRSLVREIFPPAFLDQVFSLLPSHIQIGDLSPRLMQMFCTSGSKLTFPVESVTFLAICIAASEWCDLYDGIVRPLDISVYGDDIIVPTYMVDVVMAFLEELDFSVNTEKSFFSPNQFYRESCGVEYWRGIDTSSHYYPRRPVELSSTGGNTPECLTILCSLQHKLFHCWEAQAFVKGVVRVINPKMTSHLPCTECSDLWENAPLFQTVDAPHIKGAECQVFRERHMVPHSKPDKSWKCRKSCCRHSPLIGDELRLYSMFEYYSFLKHGPRYEDSLMRLLGISMPMQSLSAISVPTQISWSMTTE